MQSWTLRKSTEHSAKQGARLDSELLLPNSRSLTITRSHVDASKGAVSKGTEWGAALQLGKSTQIANVQNICTCKI